MRMTLAPDLYFLVSAGIKTNGVPPGALVKTGRFRSRLLRFFSLTTLEKSGWSTTAAFSGN